MIGTFLQTFNHEQGLMKIPPLIMGTIKSAIIEVFSKMGKLAMEHQKDMTQFPQKFTDIEKVNFYDRNSFLDANVIKLTDDDQTSEAETAYQQCVAESGEGFVPPPPSVLDFVIGNVTDIVGKIMPKNNEGNMTIPGSPAEDARQEMKSITMDEFDILRF